AHEGFTENGGFNAALIRRRIRTSHLKKEDFSIGAQSKTEVSIMYLDNVVRPDVLDTLRRRLSKIKINGVLDSGYVEMFIQDGRFSVYPTAGNSERPDKVAAKILEGRVAVIVDGSPVVHTVPYLFCEGFQVTEDYSKSTYFATFERILRFFGTVLSLFLPAFFIVECKYPDFAPSGFSEYIAKARENIKIPVLMEVLLVFLVFELVREVGLRMPKAVGSAVGIVGSLVLGDSAVEAGIISAPVLIVVAFAAVGNFLCPPYMNANVIYRAVLIFAAGFFGIFGFFAAVCVSVALFCSKYSFGTPYLYPLAPFSLYGQLDYVLMMPLSKQKIIPTALSGKKIRRVGGENEK
ncbi:MAG: spore germination protein, partial [Clostridiales bacterium]|nr:spore germination protein [Clostridiales bacterium]